MTNQETKITLDLKKSFVDALKNKSGPFDEVVSDASSQDMATAKSTTFKSSKEASENEQRKLSQVEEGLSPNQIKIIMEKLNAEVQKNSAGSSTTVKKGQCGSAAPSKRAGKASNKSGSKGAAPAMSAFERKQWIEEEVKKISSTLRKSYEAQEESRRPRQILKCTECPVAFHKLCNAVDHVRTHFSQRPFSCGHCGQTFTQSGNRDRH